MSVSLASLATPMRSYRLPEDIRRLANVRRFGLLSFSLRVLLLRFAPARLAAVFLPSKQRLLSPHTYTCVALTAKGGARRPTPAAEEGPPQLWASAHAPRARAHGVPCCENFRSVHEFSSKLYSD